LNKTNQNNDFKNLLGKKKDHVKEESLIKKPKKANKKGEKNPKKPTQKKKKKAKRDISKHKIVSRNSLNQMELEFPFNKKKTINKKIKKETKSKNFIGINKKKSKQHIKELLNLKKLNLLNSNRLSMFSSKNKNKEKKNLKKAKKPKKKKKSQLNKNDKNKKLEAYILKSNNKLRRTLINNIDKQYLLKKKTTINYLNKVKASNLSFINVHYNSALIT
jgi:hypothetical protein